MHSKNLKENANNNDRYSVFPNNTMANMNIIKTQYGAEFMF